MQDDTAALQHYYSGATELGAIFAGARSLNLFRQVVRRDFAGGMVEGATFEPAEESAGAIVIKILGDRNLQVISEGISLSQVDMLAYEADIIMATVGNAINTRYAYTNMPDLERQDDVLARGVSAVQNTLSNLYDGSEPGAAVGGGPPKRSAVVQRSLSATVAMSMVRDAQGLNCTIIWDIVMTNLSYLLRGRDINGADPPLATGAGNNALPQRLSGYWNEFTSVVERNFALNLMGEKVSKVVQGEALIIEFKDGEEILAEIVAFLLNQKEHQ